MDVPFLLAIVAGVVAVAGLLDQSRAGLAACVGVLLLAVAALVS